MPARWTREDDAALKEYYQSTPADRFSLAEICERLGRTRFAVSIRAGRMGLSDLHRPPSAATRSLIGERHAGRPSPNRGRKFGPHTKERKEEISVHFKKQWKEWKATGTGPMSEERLQAKSDRMSLRHAYGKYQTGFCRSKSGTREDLGIFVRSSWEANVARYLNWLKQIGAVEEWSYETDTFWFHEIKRGCRSYTPDFRIVFKGDTSPTYWEVKGYMDQKSATKLKRMAKYYPEVKIILLGPREYRDLKDKAGSLPGWE